MTLRRGRLHDGWDTAPDEARVAEARPRRPRVSPMMAAAGVLVLATVAFFAMTSVASGDTPAAGERQAGLGTPTPTPSPTTPTTTPAAISTSIGPRPDLTIDKQDSPDPAAVGGPISYTITVSNIGPVDAEGVRVVDEPPPAVRIVASTPQQGECEEYVCELGTLAAGKSTTISIVVLVEEGAQSPLSNSACVSMSGEEFDVTNNCDREETSLVGGASPTALEDTLTPAPGLPMGGGRPLSEGGSGAGLLLAGAAMLISGAAAIVGALASRRARKPLWPGWRD